MLSKFDVIKQVKDNRIDLVRICFVPVSGLLKTLNIPTRAGTNALEEVLNKGSSLCDIHLDQFNWTGKVEYLIMPDPSSFRLTPFYDCENCKTALMMADILNIDGTQSDRCSRSTLKRALDALGAGAQFIVGSEIEYYIKDKDNGLPMETDLIGFGESWRDPRFTMRNKLTMDLIDMGVQVCKTHKEAGPAQDEIVLEKTDALTLADSFILATKRLIPDMLAEHGFVADFSPRVKKNIVGSGSHLHFSLVQDGRNVFAGTKGLSELANAFAKGVMDNAALLNFFLNQSVESYNRFDIGLGSPEHPTMDTTRQAMLKIPAISPDRLELRSPDNLMDIYLALTALLSAGVQGLKRASNSQHKYFAKSLREAVSIMKKEVAGKTEVLGIPAFIINSLIGKHEKAIGSTTKPSLLDSFEKRLDEEFGNLRKRFF